MKWEKAEDIKNELSRIVEKIKFPHIDIRRIICFRSFGSKSQARARIWSLPRVWQQALNIKPHYVIEVLSERYDKLCSDDQKRVLIHELLHIPKTFSGSLRPHSGRKWRLDRRMVERLFKEYKNKM